MWEQWGAWSNVALASLVSDKLIYAMVGWSLLTCIMWGLLHHLHKKEFSWCLIPAGLGRSLSRHCWIYRFTWPSNNGDWWNQWIGGIPSFWTKPSNLMNHLHCFHLKFWEINTVIWNLRYCFFTTSDSCFGDVMMEASRYDTWLAIGFTTFDSIDQHRSSSFIIGLPWFAIFIY